VFPTLQSQYSVVHISSWTNAMALNVNELVDSAFRGVVLVLASYFTTVSTTLVRPILASAKAQQHSRLKDAEQIRPRVLLFLSMALALLMASFLPALDEGSDYWESSKDFPLVTMVRNLNQAYKATETGGALLAAGVSSILAVCVVQAILRIVSAFAIKPGRLQRLRAERMLFNVGSQVFFLTVVLLIWQLFLGKSFSPYEYIREWPESLGRLIYEVPKKASGFSSWISEIAYVAALPLSLLLIVPQAYRLVRRSSLQMSGKWQHALRTVTLAVGINTAMVAAIVVAGVTHRGMIAPASTTAYKLEIRDCAFNEPTPTIVATVTNTIGRPIVLWDGIFELVKVFALFGDAATEDPKLSKTEKTSISVKTSQGARYPLIDKGQTILIYIAFSPSPKLTSFAAANAQNDIQCAVYDSEHDIRASSLDDT
jgi:hypothetical protein